MCGFLRRLGRTAVPGGLLLHRVQPPRLFASVLQVQAFFCFSHWVGRPRRAEALANTRTRPNEIKSEAEDRGHGEQGTANGYSMFSDLRMLAYVRVRRLPFFKPGMDTALACR